MQAELLSVGTQDIQTGEQILERPFREFNDMSLIDRMNLDQKDWLAWSGAQSDNPDESWMFTGTSAVTRNKIISTAAHLTSQIIYPNVYAQNEEDEEDEAAAYVMREAIEYNCRRHNYELTFLYSVISGLVNPVSYLKVDYCQAYQEILEGDAQNYTRTKVLDDVLSGFQHALIPAEEILIANPYCFDIQKQPFVIHRSRISYQEAKEYHGEHENFQHIQPGIMPMLDPSTNLFYSANDPIDDGTVEKATLSYRGRDLQITFINRIYVSNPNTEYNPMSHRTNKNKPKYNIVKFGAEPIDAMHFWAYKSLAAKLSNDKELVDRMRQNAVDASTFATFPSIFTSGAGKLDRSVFIPATVQEIGKDAKVFPASGMMNPAPAFTAAREAEQQMNDTSIDPQLSGVNSGNSQTARQSMILQENAITNLGIMGRMIAQEMVKPMGELMIDDILRYQTVGELQELSGGTLGMKYQTLVLQDKIKDGQKKSVVIRFTDSWAGQDMSDDEKEKRALGLYEEGGDKKEIYEVNPQLWLKMDYAIVVEPDALKPKNDAFERTIKLETYDRAIMNPLISQDPEKMAEVTRDFLFEPTVHGDAAKYIPKQTMQAMQGLVPPPQGQTQGVKSGVTGRVMQGQAMQNLLTK